MNNSDKFDYTYSAPTENERREIEDIRKLYDAPPKAESDLENLRKLNKKVTNPPKIVAAVMCVFGVLIFGLGMTCVLEWTLYLWGVLISFAGAGVLGATYPVYRAILKRNKEKYGRQIIELSDKLLNKEEAEG